MPMAGVLNIPQPPFYRPVSGSRRVPRTSFSIRATSDFSEAPVTPSSSATSTKEKPEPISISAPPNFKPPEPKPFRLKPDKALDILGASLALLFRLGTGAFVSGYSASFVSKDEIPPDQYALQIAGFKVKETSKLGPRPEKPIEIYEFESCPFCRKVREIVAVLDLDVLYYPCPRNGPNFRPKVIQMGGKRQYPYMIDPNTGVSLYESDEIIKYLAGKYGDGTVPLMLSLGLLTTLTEGFAMIARMGKGTSYTPSKMPPKPLEIWAYEASPFCKVVREVLVELELPHLYRSCARGSPKRHILYEKAKHFQAPYLEDPNTGVQMFESAEIVEYLKATYAK
ncbi:Thioredoxin family protein [Melia azedarach]|uniref:Thioredoxin family protein n=2 Tax=Melia azedarach TaxID=155640 RepID=A0ACC1X3N3_MELAZ|nr:Thioredoxin family protein [Melia azedarach]KAJ4705249.1 Thioredoxin family protein [Melia azedarach]